MPASVSRIASTIALAALVAACGGSGGSPTPSAGTVTIAPTPTPTPAPSPVPSPSSTAPRSLFPLGLTQLTSFPTLSWVYDSADPADPDPAAVVNYEFGLIDVTWWITLPGGGRGLLQMHPTETGHDYTGAFFSSRGGHSLYTLAPGLENPVFPLEATSVGYWGWSSYNGASPGATGGVLAYGVPAGASDIPATGTSRYRLYGFAVTRAPGVRGYPEYKQFDGAADISFSAGTFSGDFGTARIPGYANYGTLAERFAFAATTVSADRTSFIGRLTVPGVTGDATFEGRFTGAGARELMLRWKAPYRNIISGRTETLFGVLVGRRS